MITEPKTKRIILIIATVLLVLCALWYIFRDTDSERSRICTFLKEHGYDVYEDDLLFAYDERNTSIKAALEMNEQDLSDAVKASESGGFPSDVNKSGDVTLILARADDDTIFMYMLDGEFELVFVQDSDGNVETLKQLA